MSPLRSAATRRLFVALLLTAGLAVAPSIAGAQTFSNAGFGATTVATLPPFTPVGLAFAPDGRIFVWLKPGVVRIVKNGVLLTTPFVDIQAQTNQFGDRGLLGLAIDPDFATNGFVYLLHTYESGGDPNSSAPRTSRLTRVTANPANPDVALPGSEVAILQDIPSDSSSHSIGTVRFAPDETLFVGSGDGGEFNFVDERALRAQNLDSPNGKILRINRDGTAPIDNPFHDGTNSIRSKVWAYGLRNPFRFSLHPVSGEPVIGDVGWNEWEEVNVGRGANFGWPCYEGNAPHPGYQAAFVECQALAPSAVTPPLYAYNHGTPDAFGVSGATVIAGPVYSGTQYPVQFQGSLFIADYVGEWIKRIVFDAGGNFVSVVPFATNVDGPVAVEQGPDGFLYFVTLNSGEIRRVTFNGPIAQASATPTSGYSPLNVSFSSAGSIATNGGPLTYAWTFGDGGTSSSPNPSHTYTAAGVASFTATLTVTDSGGQTASDSVVVTVGSTPPTPTITAPADGLIVFPGQEVVYQGSATDPDQGPLSGASLSWMVLLHHNTHLHVVQNSEGPQGSVLISNHGDGEFAYEIVLTARDSSGLTGTTSVIIPVNPNNLIFPTALTLATAAVQGGDATTATVTLSAPAPAGGAVVALASDHAVATVPASVTVAAGSTTGQFPVTTTVVGTPTVATLSATLNGIARTDLTVNPALGGRVAEYSFGEGTGTLVADSSGQGNHGTLTGAAWTAQGRFGSALSFDGVNGFVTVPDATTLDLGAAGTMEAWVRLAQVDRWHGVIAKGNANSDSAHNYAIEINHLNRVLCVLGNGAASRVLTSASTVVAGQFYHLACTWNGTTLALYIDGALDASVAQSFTPTGNTAPLFLGQFGGNSDRLSGIIDEVRLSSRALSLAEIQQDMATPVGGTPPPDTTPPSAPGTLTATAVGTTQINLAWGAATDNVGVTAYLVERCQGPGCSDFAQVTSTASTSFNNTGLQTGTSYSYRVRATDAAGNPGPFSNTATDTTQTPPPPDTTPPSAPGTLSATAVGPTQINLAWGAATDNVGVTAYLVERCQGAGCSTFAQITSTAATTFNNTGLLAGTSYSYRVRATDAAGNPGPFSNTATAATQASTGLVAAYGFGEGTGSLLGDSSGNANHGSITGAAWTAQGQSGSALSFNGTSSFVTVPDAASLDLTTGTMEAWVRLAAVNRWHGVLAKGNANSDPAHNYAIEINDANRVLCVLGNGTTSRVLTSTVTLAANQFYHLACTWNGTTLALYVNGALNTSGAQTVTPAGNTAPLSIGQFGGNSDRLSGVIDEVRVYNRALPLAEIQQDMATPVGGTPPPDTTPPSAPGTLTATAVGTTQINLAWGAATDNVGVTGYLVERCQGAGCSNFAQITTTAGTTFNNTGLLSGTSYSYRVRASDAAGNPGPFSNTATATTQAAPDTTPPSPPGTLTATAASTSQINLSWGAATDNVGVTSYLVERCQGAGCSNFAQITSTASLSFNNTGLLAGTSYSYRVRATDAAGNPGPFSNTATAATQASTGLVAAYGFGEGTGSLLGDSSGNANHGSITGAAWTAQGQFGSALSFNGTSSFVTVPDAASLDLTTGTMEAWVRLAAVNRWHGVLAKGNANSDPAHNYAIEINPANRVLCVIGNGATSRVLTSTVTVAANQFYHLACTWNGSTLSLYINGTLNTSIAQNITPAGNSAPLSIGQFGGNSDRLSGIVDEVRLYNRALTPAEIQQDRTTPIP